MNDPVGAVIASAVNARAAQQSSDADYDWRAEEIARETADRKERVRHAALEAALRTQQVNPGSEQVLADAAAYLAFLTA